MKRKVEAIQNPLLANLTKRNNQMAFASNAPRFGKQKIDEAETFLGPGYYEQKSQFGDKSRTANYRMNNQT